MEEPSPAELAKARIDTRALVLFRDVFADEIGQRFVQLLDAAAAPDETAPAARAERIVAAFSALSGALIEQVLAAGEGDGPTPGAWRSYVAARILHSDNCFTRLAERGGHRGIPPSLARVAAADLFRLQRLARLDPERLIACAEATLPERWRGELARPPKASEETEGWPSLLGDDWSEAVDRLADHIHRRGAGEFGRHHFFRWTHRAGGGRLEPVLHPDPTRLEDLIGYDAERAVVIRNTEKLIRGLPAHNVLLYGDRGTGKSATVKALVHRYAPAGLRLIEVSKSDLHGLGDLLQRLAERGLAFIIFIDDLSFEESETAYKELKALFEGSAAARPQNVVLYATSNRRHLIREEFSDRAEGPLGRADDEIHRADTVQEKLSLADRFGLTVIFPSPDQAAYLAIVAGLVRRRGLVIDPAELRQRALRWAAWQNGWSARSARQFVDELQGDLGLEKAASGAPSAAALMREG
ncbi:MAG TPA: ATP-binding protein [Limnochordia bacterium]